MPVHGLVQVLLFVSTIRTVLLFGSRRVGSTDFCNDGLVILDGNGATVTFKGDGCSVQKEDMKSTAVKTDGLYTSEIARTKQSIEMMMEATKGRANVTSCHSRLRHLGVTHMLTLVRKTQLFRLAFFRLA